MPNPKRLDLTQVSALTEIIVRGGNLHDPHVNVRDILQNNYRVFSVTHGVYGLSVLVNTTAQQGVSYSLLAQRNPIFNRKLSLSVIGIIKVALKQAGYGMVLFVTPSRDLPDHHSLVVFDVDPMDKDDRPLSVVYDELPDAAADALISAFSQVVDNPFPKPRP